MGILRCTVYGIIALRVPPARHAELGRNRRSSRRSSRCFDVSGSMASRDDPPVEGMDVAKLPTRQDKVLSLLEGKTGFLARLGEKNPVFSYRFGGGLDEDFHVLDREGQFWPRSAWESRLHKPGRATGPGRDEACGPEGLAQPGHAPPSPRTSRTRQLRPRSARSGSSVSACSAPPTSAIPC